MELNHHQLEITDFLSSKEEWFEQYSYLLMKESKPASLNPTSLFVTWPRDSRSVHSEGSASKIMIYLWMLMLNILDCRDMMV